MRLRLYSWDGHQIDDTTNYNAVIEPGNAMPAATATFIDLGQGDPILAGKVLDGGYFTFVIVLRGNVETQRDELNKWFRTNDFTFRQLLAYDLDSGNKDWYLEGYPVTAPMISEGSTAKYSITLALKQPYWIEADENTDTWSVTADTETQTITAVGNIPALPKFEITAVQAKASNDLKYKTFYAIHTSGWGAQKIPIDITGGGLDTATLTTAKMRADGYDVGININGVYVDRWFGVGAHAFDTAATTIWVNMNFTPAPSMTLSVTLPNNDTVPATLKAAYTSASISLPQNSTLQIETELITYSSYTVDTATKIITFVPTLRAAKGSSYAGHSAGVAVYWIENEVWLTYGNSSATVPSINDTVKPILDLENSVNGSWKYLLFGSSTGLRSGVPKKGGNSTDADNFYTGSHGASADPFTEVGLKLASLLRMGHVVINSAGIFWNFNHSGGISNFAANGDKYRSGANFPSSTLVLNSVPNGTIYDTITSPTLAATWEPVTVNEACADNPANVYLFMAGGIGTTLPIPYALIELQDVTLTIYAPPTITAMGVEQANYKFTGSLVNDTSTGDESILFNNLLTKTAVKLTIDCDTQEIYSADGKRLRGMIQFGGPKRDEWMSLLPGANSIIFTDVGTVEVTIVTKWRGRNTI